MKSRWIGLLLVLAAIPLYLSGLATGAAVLLILGAMLELTGWIRLFRPADKGRR